MTHKNTMQLTKKILQKFSSKKCHPKKGPHKQTFLKKITIKKNFQLQNLPKII